MEYFKQYLKFCLFRGSLYELPKSVPFLQTSLIIYLVVSFLIQANISEPIGAFFESLIEIVFTTIIIFVLLIFAGKFSSFVQTFTAFIICEIVIFILMLPIAVWLDFFNDIVSMYVCGILVVLYIFWYLSIISHLIRQLLSISKLASFILSFSYTLATYGGTFMMLQF